MSNMFTLILSPIPCLAPLVPLVPWSHSFAPVFTLYVYQHTCIHYTDSHKPIYRCKNLGTTKESPNTAVHILSVVLPNKRTERWKRSTPSRPKSFISHRLSLGQVPAGVLVALEGAKFQNPAGLASRCCLRSAMRAVHRDPVTLTRQTDQ